jgi:hypothetical protein
LLEEQAAGFVERGAVFEYRGGDERSGGHWAQGAEKSKDSKTQN